MYRREFLKTAGAAFAALSTIKASTIEAHEGEHQENVKKLVNRKDPSVLEMKHVPLVEAPGSVKPGSWFDVTVRVGYKTEHPSTPKHWISDIRLLSDGQVIAETKFRQGGATASKAVFTIRLDKSTELSAIETCNLHGTWISDPVRVMA